MRPLTDYKKIHLIHMRKAGGTTARRMLERICDLHGISFIASEGWPMSQADLDDDTFVIANFRDPFERICSLYNAEGRRMHQGEGKPKARFFEWIRSEELRHTPRLGPLWRYIDNYYVRSFCDYTMQTKRPQVEVRARELSNSDYHSAVVGLMRVDLIMICEWLNEDSHRRYLSSRLVGNNTGLIRIPHENRTVQRNHYDVRKELDKHDRERILASHSMDVDLYRVAQWRAKYGEF